jgi:hypothetical protein
MEKRDITRNTRLAWWQAETSQERGCWQQRKLGDVASSRSSSSKWTSIAAARVGDRQQELGDAGPAELSDDLWGGVVL